MSIKDKSEMFFLLFKLKMPEPISTFLYSQSVLFRELMKILS